MLGLGPSLPHRRAARQRPQQLHNLGLNAYTAEDDSKHKVLTDKFRNGVVLARGCPRRAPSVLARPAPVLARRSPANVEDASSTSAWPSTS